MLLSVVFYFYSSDKIFKCRSTVNLKELHFVKTFHFIDKFLSLGKNLWWIYNSFKLIFPPSLVANTFFQAIYMQISIDTKRVNEENRQDTPHTLQYIFLKVLLSAKTVERNSSISVFDVGPVALFPHHCIREQTRGHVEHLVR